MIYYDQKGEGAFYTHAQEYHSVIRHKPSDQIYECLTIGATSVASSAFARMLFRLIGHFTNALINTNPHFFRPVAGS